MVTLLTVKLHEEVIKFLETAGTVQVDEDGITSYVVNNTMYVETNEPGLYLTMFIQQ